jgi:hypothetical protein
VTQPEALIAAREIAASEGWEWIEPAEAVGGAAQDGRTTWVVCSTADAYGVRTYVVLGGAGDVVASGRVVQ